MYFLVFRDRCLITSFSLSLVCYDAVFYVVLLLHFICIGAIQTSKIDSINRKYQIIVIGILKNLSRKYSIHCIIKSVGFIPTYYAINLNIVSAFMNFSNLYFGSIDLLQV